MGLNISNHKSRIQKKVGRVMKNAKCILLLMAALMVLAGCEVKMAPSKVWQKVFKPETNSKYYRDKTDSLVGDITRDIEEYEINKIVVLDLVDNEGRVPILGEYISNRVVESVTRGKYFRVAQRGEMLETLGRLNLKPSFRYTKEEIQRIGRAMNAQAVVNGKVRDLGANIDVHIALVDISSGEVIASATEHLNRTKFAVELLHHY